MAAEGMQSHDQSCGNCPTASHPATKKGRINAPILPKPARRAKSDRLLAREGLMQRPLVVLLALTAASIAAPARAADGAVCVENATIDDLQGALAAGRTTAADLVRAYAARIEAYDRAGPRLHAVREMNPHALTIAPSIVTPTSH